MDDFKNFYNTTKKGMLMDAKTIKNLSLASAVAMTLGIPLESSAAAYLKIGDIKGEAAHDDHKDWIDVLSWGWGASEGDRGKTCVSEMSFNKNIDSATDDLAQSIPTGRVFETAQLVFEERDAGTSQPAMKGLKYDLTNVRITSLSQSGSDFGVSESFSISFEELTGTYKKSDTDPGETFIIPANECK